MRKFTYWAGLLFLMPLGVVTESDIDAVCRILENTLAEVADAVEATTTHG